MFKKLFKPLCWLGFHYWRGYISNNLVMNDDNIRTRTTMRTCLICEHKQYRYDMIYRGNYYGGVWRWYK